MKKLFKGLAMLILLPILLLGCGNSEDISDNGKINIMVSISPLKEFVENIGGDKVNVTSLVPDNVEAHDFELKTRDIEKIMDKDLFIYNGVGMEDWLHEVESSASNSKVKFIDSSINSTIITGYNHVHDEEHNDEDHNDEDHEEEDHDDEDHEEEQKDPHLWLSLKEAKNQCKTILEALVEIDSKNKDYYTDKYNTYTNSLDELYDEYLPKFESLSKRQFITSHSAFGYLCRDFGLSQESLTDLYGEGEATAKTYERLINYCKENNIDTIFYEGSQSSKEAETLANEIKGKVKNYENY